MSKRLGIITGPGIPDFKEIEQRRWKVIETPFGNQQLYLGYLGNREVAWCPRQGIENELIPTLMNPRSMLFALDDVGCEWIVGVSSVGVVDKAIPLAHPILFDDLFFPSNRLPDGSACTFFVPGSDEFGHFVFEKPFSPGLRHLVMSLSDEYDLEIQHEGVLAQSLGPRLETSSEIRLLSSIGVSAVTMSSGYEAVLAGELKKAYINIGFGVNYATGVMPWASGSDELKDNNEDIAPLAKELLKSIGASSELDTITFDTGNIMKS